MQALPQTHAIYALTASGAEIARSLKKKLDGAILFLPARLADIESGELAFEKIADCVKQNFFKFEGHIFFAATGIVVRAIAPLIKSKTNDPAIVVVDPEGSFAISLLSGHLGGANALARQVAHILGGQAVITTATDNAEKPGLDILADLAGMKIENISALPRISRAILEDEPVPVYDPENWLWPELENWPHLFKQVDQITDEHAGRHLVWVGFEAAATDENWLVLRPPCLTVGLGCNRGTSADEIDTLLEESFRSAQLSPASIRALATVDIKQDEDGLLDLAKNRGVEIIFFTPEELNKIKVPNPSQTVKDIIGASSICEAAAILAAQNGRLILEKQKSQNATMAVALAGSI